MKVISVPISVGELIDKVTILRIKQKKIDAPEKLAHINHELKSLLEVCESGQIDLGLEDVSKLEQVNLELWQIEDDIREKERAKAFDQEFIELARAVYVTNDQRFALKDALNRHFGSEYFETKSYKPY